MGAEGPVQIGRRAKADPAISSRIKNGDMGRILLQAGESRGTWRQREAERRLSDFSRLAYRSATFSHPEKTGVAKPQPVHDWRVVN